MEHQTILSRRRFIKAAGVAGGTAVLAGLRPAAARAAQDGPDPDLAGISDIHIHAAPDSRPRSIDELGFARQAMQAGYRSIMYKSNDFSCHDRAWLVQQALPGFDCFGSLCMNRVHGDRVNPTAAEKAIQTTGGRCRCIWLPTLDAAYQHRQEKRPGQGIPVLDENGRVLPEVVRVMEQCAEADIILASGHASPEESLVLAARAAEVGLGKFVVTHANSLIWKMTGDQIKRAVDLGAWIEFCCLNLLWGPGTGLPQYARDSEEEFVRLVSIAPERSFVTTDLGQRDMPNPLDGMRACLKTLERGGISRAGIDVLVRRNPARLIGLEPR